uniref:Tudor domain-containing protein n=1 Tax=Tetranychus urticae TaxID=32264 RepID=T1K5I4_TETUR
MNTFSSLERPLIGPSDPLKLLVCKKCKKDDVVLNLKTCGCLLCDSCDGDSKDLCVSCQSRIESKLKLSFSKNRRCEYYDQNKCNSNAEYKCNCIPDCFVCSSCLTNIHRKRVRGSCVPELLIPKVTTNHETCQLCKEFIAEFKMASEPYTKICFNCKKRKNVTCTSIETDSDKDTDFDQFYEELGQCSRSVLDEISDMKSLGTSRPEQEMQKCMSALSEIRKSMAEHTQFVEHKRDSFKKISNVLKPNGTIKTILDLLKNGQLALHGEKGKAQIRDLLHYYEEKNNYSRFSLAEQIKSFVIQNDSSRQHILKFPLPASSNSGVSTDSDTGVREIKDNGVKPFFVLVEKPSQVNERRKILEDIQKHEDKWVRKERFDHGEIVIIFDADATDSPKYKRAKISRIGNRKCNVSLLDFGYKTQVENSLVGEIKDLQIDGTPTCFLAQLTGSINVKCMNPEVTEFFQLPKAYTIFL